MSATAALVCFALVGHHTTSDPVPPAVLIPDNQPLVAVQPDPFVYGERVHFQNPFDPSETFDFPPGTTKADARRAVAAVLRERATQRQQDARTAGRLPNRRSGTDAT